MRPAAASEGEKMILKESRARYESDPLGLRRVKYPLLFVANRRPYAIICASQGTSIVSVVLKNYHHPPKIMVRPQSHCACKVGICQKAA
jgi:hypothetical protein